MDISSIIKTIGKVALAAGVTAFAAALTGRESKNTNNADDKPWTDRDCDWYCDRCGELMNDQPGFNAITGTWTCLYCGEVNDVSEDNIFDAVDDAPYDPEYDEP